MPEEFSSSLLTSEEMSSEEISSEELSSEELSSEESSSEVVQTVYVLSDEQASQLSNINATVTFVTIIIGIAFIIWLIDFVVKKLSSYL